MIYTQNTKKHRKKEREISYGFFFAVLIKHFEFILFIYIKIKMHPLNHLFNDTTSLQPLLLHNNLMCINYLKKK